MKLSIELIKHLENMNTWKSFRKEYDTLHEKNPAYANTFAGMLEICRGLNIRNASYLIVGGLAVASYLFKADNTALRDWRGTYDIDIMIPDKRIAEEVLNFANYEFRQTQPSKIGMKGYLYDYAKEDNGETTVVGLRKGLVNSSGKDMTDKLIKRSEIIPVYGVRVSVPSLKDLVEMKRFANRNKDRADLKYLRKFYKKI